MSEVNEYKCHYCWDTGFLVENEPCSYCRPEDYQAWQDQEQVRRAEERSIQEFGYHFKDKTLDNFDAHNPPLRKALESVRHYLEDLEQNLSSGKGLTLIGPVCTGKSHLMVGLKKAAAVKGARMAMINMIDLLMECRQTFGQRPGHYQESDFDVMKKYFDTAYLILDDFGVELNTKPGADNSWIGRLLYYLIHKRWVNGRPTFITTNYELERLEILLGDFGDRIVDRLVRMNGPAILIKADRYTTRRPDDR